MLTGFKPIENKRESGVTLNNKGRIHFSKDLLPDTPEKIRCNLFWNKEERSLAFEFGKSGQYAVYKGTVEIKRALKQIEYVLPVETIHLKYEVKKDVLIVLLALKK